MNIGTGQEYPRLSAQTANRFVQQAKINLDDGRSEPKGKFASKEDLQSNGNSRPMLALERIKAESVDGLKRHSFKSKHRIYFEPQNDYRLHKPTQFLFCSQFVLKTYI